MNRTAVNEPIDHELVSRIKIGASARQVVEIMGAPDQIVQLGRRTAYRFQFTVDKGSGSYWIVLALYNEDTRRDTVWFFFDENEVLTHVGSTYHSHRAMFAMLPSSDIYDPADAEAADKARGLK